MTSDSLPVVLTECLNCLLLVSQSAFLSLSLSVGLPACLTISSSACWFPGIYLSALFPALSFNQLVGQYVILSVRACQPVCLPISQLVAGPSCYALKHKLKCLLAMSVLLTIWLLVRLLNQFINIFGYLFVCQLVIYLSGCQLANVPAAHSACQHVSLPISLSAWLFTY